MADVILVGANREGSGVRAKEDGASAVSSDRRRTGTSKTPPDAALLRLRAAFLSMVTAKGLDDLSMRQLAVLLTLHRATTAITVRGLAVDLKVLKPTITKAMNRLVLNRLAQRTPDSADRRSVLLEITDAGAKLADSMAEAMRSGTVTENNIEYRGLEAKTTNCARSFRART